VIIFLGILNVLLLAGLIALGVHCEFSSSCLKYGKTQIDADRGMVVMTDKNSSAFFLSGSCWSKLGSVPLKHVSVGPAGIWGVDQQNKYYVSETDFTGLELKQVDAGGQGQVVGVAKGDTIHCLTANKASSIKEIINWTSGIAGFLIYISCAPTGCWGVNAQQSIFFTVNSCLRALSPGNWIQVDGEAVNVEVGSDGNVFVVNRLGLLYERTGISDQVPQGTGWKKIEMSVKIKHASYDLGYMWLVTEEGFIVKCTK
uniref:Fish-egg lectin n=1 Tax=Poecilia reticulata TaxID=8081 RepID=A0A3P9PG85_POERE